MPLNQLISCMSGLYVKEMIDDENFVNKVMLYRHQTYHLTTQILKLK